MFKYSAVFSGFSVNDLEKAEEFYKNVLGFSVINNPMGLIELEIPGNNNILIYPKPEHQPADFTVLNIPVENIDEAVNHLTKIGVKFERYEGEIETDKKGICRSDGKEPNLAWFKDRAGNIISILEEKS
ncbi:VOC family protein [Salegentibacter salegens]|uniref:Glyoxalase/Bleomycin resistance protein/Dioxygenase superfamily protein n=1 Tax=Salegentibacter salegens TaxID=143223 RepID=A0A1M7J5V8_9FLAO|nr:VOC family protein [Salegentibacter salegens]PRX47350.1 glyoxalase/bleomycin resistance protein/dioxygenase superfamily protein [Salegentibacter salegens]SHM48308.1 Glyoxalase/Bleomycin resistance protein/Dioxygenase superfamily protein [Salegentibacter salegens]